MLNTDLLDKTLEVIKAEPERHDQEEWVSAVENICDTTMCFAGHALILSGQYVLENRGRFADIYEKGTERVANYSVDAGDLLGLTWEQADALFYCMGGVEEIEEIVNRIKAGEQFLSENEDY